MGPTIVVLSAWYLLAQVVVAWVFNPGHREYSFVGNTISDLGNTACGNYGGSWVCSPRHVLMNASIIALGAAMLVCSVLIYTEFTVPAAARAGSWEARRQGWGAKFGFTSMALGGAGAVVVGAAPENVNGTAHILGAAGAIGGGGIAILVLGALLLSLPEGMRHYMLIAGSIAAVAAFSFAFKHHFGLGAGGMERLAQYPQSIWLIMLGLYTTRDHYVRGLTGRFLRFHTRAP